MFNQDETKHKAALTEISKITGQAIHSHPLDCTCELCQVHQIARAAISNAVQTDLFSFAGAVQFMEQAKTAKI